MYFQYIFICVARYVYVARSVRLVTFKRIYLGICTIIAFSTFYSWDLYDQFVYYLLLLGFVRSVRLLPPARTLRLKRTYRTWHTPDKIFGEFCNF